MTVSMGASEHLLGLRRAAFDRLVLRGAWHFLSNTAWSYSSVGTQQLSIWGCSNRKRPTGGAEDRPRADPRWGRWLQG